MKQITLNGQIIGIESKFLPFIDHPLFQRLYRISRVETVCKAYPGATQNRFQHSLGTFGLACLYVQNISANCAFEKIPEEDADAFKLSALYHDIGHCAFSHAFDRTVAKKVFPNTSKPHDLRRFELLDIIFSQIETSINIDKVKQIWGKKHYLSPLLNGPINVDRMDFIQRDILYTGKSNLGFPPIERMMKYTFLVKKFDENNEPILKIVYDARLCLEIEQFLKMRQIMYTSVYFHHTSISGSILIDKLILALEDFGLLDMYKNEFINITDDYILNWVKFDPRLKHLIPLVMAITLQRKWLPKRKFEKILSEKDLLPEFPDQTLGVINWDSGPIASLNIEEFKDIDFMSDKKLCSAEEAFNIYKIRSGTVIRILRQYVLCSELQ